LWCFDFFAWREDANAAYPKDTWRLHRRRPCGKSEVPQTKWSFSTVSKTPLLPALGSCAPVFHSARRAEAAYPADTCYLFVKAKQKNGTQMLK